MKTPFLLKCILLLFLVTSCSKSDDNGGDETPDNEITSISLSTDETEVNTNDHVVFTVTGNSNENLSSQSTFKVDGVTTSNPIFFDAEGSFEVVATYEDLTSNKIIITVSDVPPTSITLEFDKVCYSKGDSATFLVKDNFGNEVTSQAVVTVNGTVITANPYPLTTVGAYDFTATYEDLTTSETLNATSDAGAPSMFTKKVLLEDFTGTWCPQCPPAASAVATAISGNSNIFGVGYHASGGDPMEIPETAYWSNYYNVTGFPTVYVNGPDTRWNYPNMAQVDTELAEEATLGLALEARIVAGKLDLVVNVGFSATPDEELKLMVYLVEDNVTTSTPQAGSSEGVNYVHRDVLREVYTNQLGDVIPSSSAAAGCIYTRTFTGLDLPSNIDDMNELKVIVYVRNSYNKTFVDYFGTTHTDSPHYDIYNVQEVHPGETQDFD